MEKVCKHHESIYGIDSGEEKDCELHGSVFVSLYIFAFPVARN